MSKPSIMENLPIWLLVACFHISCAAPEEPESLQKSSGSEEESSGNVSRASRVFNFGGAAVGDSDMRAAVKSCVEKGLFYNRSSGNSAGCTSYSLAKVDCTDEGVKASMSVGFRRGYEANLKSNDPSYGLAGFQVDQCIDCPTAEANSFCASAVNGNPGKKPGFLIMLLKPSGTQLHSRMQYVIKE